MERPTEVVRLLVNSRETVGDSEARPENQASFFCLATCVRLLPPAAGEKKDMQTPLNFYKIRTISVLGAWSPR